MAKVDNNNSMTHFIIQERVKRFLADGKFEEAENYYLKSLKFKEQAYGSDDPSLLPLLKEITTYYEHVNEDEKALEFRKRCENIEGQKLESSKEIKVEKAIQKDKKEVKKTIENQSNEVFPDEVREKRKYVEPEVKIPEVEIETDIKQKQDFPRSYYYGQIARVLDHEGSVSNRIAEWAKYPGKMVLELGTLKPPANSLQDQRLIQIMSSVSPFEPADLNVENEKSANDQVAFWMGYYSKEAIIS